MTGRASTLSPEVDLPSLLPGSVLDAADPADPDGGHGGRRRRTLRDWVVDVTCFVACLGLGALLVAQAQQADRPMTQPLLTLDVAAGLACCVAVWWRRRWPVGLAVVTALAGAFSLMSGVTGVVMLFTVAVHRRARVAVALAVASLVTLPVFRMLHHESTDPPWVDVTVAVLITAVALGWGMFTRARRQLLVTLRERAVRAEREQHLRVDQARRTERARIAREMHDVLAHRITLLSVHAGALEFRTDASHEQVAEAAGVIRANAHQALEELREVIGVLREDDGPARPDGRPAPPEPPQPGLTQIPALVEESREAGATVRYRCGVADLGAVPASTARTAYRAVQEGLTNARKHAPGTPIEVAVDGGPAEGLTVEVANPAPAWPPVATVPGAGLGLVGLAERVQLAGGRIEHGRDDARFVLRVSLPWQR